MHCQNIVDGICVQKEFFKNIFVKIKYTSQILQTDKFWTLSWPFSCDYSFWLRDLKFGTCIKDSINKTCWKNGIDLSKGLLKLNFETRPKKRIFRFLPKISAGHGWSWNFFFANCQILGPLGCQGWVVIPQNVKKSQNHCTLVHALSLFTNNTRAHFLSTHGSRAHCLFTSSTSTHFLCSPTVRAHSLSLRRTRTFPLYSLNVHTLSLFANNTRAHSLSTHGARTHCLFTPSTCTHFLCSPTIRAHILSLHTAHAHIVSLLL